jgi:hypothetical protein
MSKQELHGNETLAGLPSSLATVRVTVMPQKVKSVVWKMHMRPQGEGIIERIPKKVNTEILRANVSFPQEDTG